MTKKPVNIFWFRRDLRLEDNIGLYHALKSDRPVLPIFIFDKHILDKLDDKNDARVSFIHQELSILNNHLKGKGSTLLTFYDHPEAVFKQLTSQFQINTVFANRDYEPYALRRDQLISSLMNSNSIAFRQFKDHVILEPHEVLKDNDNPYTVFTPYSRKWKHTLKNEDLESVSSALKFDNFLQHDFEDLITLKHLGFNRANTHIADKQVSKVKLKKYDDQRDYPGLDGTSKLGVHLRFGTISIRKLARAGIEISDTYLNELIWREFYQMILWHFPRVVNENFKKKYNAIDWRNNEQEFDLWCNGQTGYPIVDAGMRELNATGYMHNRVRMIVASFLTKHLLIDWRWGEAYFAQKLLDYELASNNGGWQWAAGTGTDAQPYFRIFNPESQTKKFDPELKYIKKWVPEFQELTYPSPIVDHKIARERALTTYKKALNP